MQQVRAATYPGLQPSQIVWRYQITFGHRFSLSSDAVDVVQVAAASNPTVASSTLAASNFDFHRCATHDFIFMQEAFPLIYNTPDCFDDSAMQCDAMQCDMERFLLLLQFALSLLPPSSPLSCWCWQGQVLYTSASMLPNQTIWYTSLIIRG